MYTFNVYKEAVQKRMSPERYLMEIREKFNILKCRIKEMDSVAVAFSGGVDSTFLLKAAFDVLSHKVLAITAVSECFPEKESAKAKTFAEAHGIRHIIVNSDGIGMEEFRLNTVNRCYVCKKNLFLKFKNIAKENRMERVIDASNSDDLKDFRPGLKALKELGIESPLMDAGLTKADIRELSREMGLGTWDDPSRACLASRFPYGTEITRERLTIVGQAEEFLDNLGFRQNRVRFHENIARIEILKEDFNMILQSSDEISLYFKQLGFAYVTLDLQGFRSGSMNEVL